MLVVLASWVLYIVKNALIVKPRQKKKLKHNQQLISTRPNPKI